jgi:beta-galactosidase
MKKAILPLILLSAALAAAAQPIGREQWNDNWSFSKDGTTRTVTLPHDWGVEAPFAQEYPGESGKLPWWGQASYSKTLTVQADDLKQDIRLEVDGAMSNARVYVNGQEAPGAHPYGYASWAVELNPWLREGGNLIEIKLDNKPESSRWYPGGGIYRNVWLTRSAKTAVAHWGTSLSTHIGANYADVFLNVTVQTDKPRSATITTRILHWGQVVAQISSTEQIYDGREVKQRIRIADPEFWSPDSPEMYVARTTVETGEGTTDSYDTPFGIRDAQWKADGFYLNGVKTFLKGVCLHHDAGALGAAWNEDAWVRRLTMLKAMGCNAIRTSHNPQAPEFLDLCDKLGFLVLDELTDTWTVPKKENGYATLFDEWVEKDLVALIHRDRNHPSVIAWSIGNECGEQGMQERWWIPQRLTDICHREDPTRPTTAGNDNPWAASQPYAGTIDLYGFNYKPHQYAAFRDSHPGQPFYGSETASCISTRGYYLFPVEEEKDKGWTQEAPFQVSSYDLYAPAWASKPDYEWGFEDQVPECAGEFVWTGYDYLGEPTPFNLDPSVLTNFHTEEEKEAYKKLVAGWGQTISEVPLPSRSSYFGILDLAGFPKDRYWLYQSRWNPEVPMAHILPHWTWPGREGKTTPVHVYSSADEAELFLNGKSLGRQAREGYRFVWPDVVYAPGTLEVVTYKDGKEWARDKVRTAGKAAKLQLSYDWVFGEDLFYFTADILDKNGNPVPDASNELSFSVKGPMEIVATDAGDPTSHIPFYSTSLPAFHGKASVIFRRTGSGSVTVTVSAKGLKTAKYSFKYPISFDLE